MRKTPLILMAAALPMAVNAANTEFSFGGYAKLDVIASEFSDGQPAADNAGRNFNIPATIPTSDGKGKSSSGLEFHAKQTRINFKSVSELKNGQKVTGFVEMDFYGGGGNERVSNSSNPRLRHAFIKTGNWTFGQTWSTFMNTAALPETVDFLGIAEGTPFARQSMIRYTNGGLQLALENAEATVSNGVDGKRVLSDTSSIPDVIAKYTLKSGDHTFSAAAIARTLDYKTADNTIDKSTTGFGVSFAGVMKLSAADTLKFSANHGALGRYVGLNTANDAAMIGNDLKETNLTAGYVALQHKWSDKMRSNLTYSLISIDNDKNVKGDQNKEASSVRLNLMYQPDKKLTYGVELGQGKLEKESGNDGTQTSVHFTAIYGF